MKSHDTGADTTQYQPAAEPCGRAPVRSVHGVATAQRSALQMTIDQSPRMLAQRDAIQRVFGTAHRQPAYGLGAAAASTAVQFAAAGPVPLQVARAQEHAPVQGKFTVSGQLIAFEDAMNFAAGLDLPREVFELFHKIAGHPTYHTDINEFLAQNSRAQPETEWKQPDPPKPTLKRDRPPSSKSIPKKKEPLAPALEDSIEDPSTRLPPAELGASTTVTHLLRALDENKDISAYVGKYDDSQTVRKYLQALQQLVPAEQASPDLSTQGPPLRIPVPSGVRLQNPLAYAPAFQSPSLLTSAPQETSTFLPSFRSLLAGEPGRWEQRPSEPTPDSPITLPPLSSLFGWDPRLSNQASRTNSLDGPTSQGPTPLQPARPTLTFWRADHVKTTSERKHSGKSFNYYGAKDTIIDFLARTLHAKGRGQSKGLADVFGGTGTVTSKTHYPGYHLSDYDALTMNAHFTSQKNPFKTDAITSGAINAGKSKQTALNPDSPAPPPLGILKTQRTEESLRGELQQGGVGRPGQAAHFLIEKNASGHSENMEALREKLVATPVSLANRGWQQQTDTTGPIPLDFDVYLDPPYSKFTWENQKKQAEAIAQSKTLVVPKSQLTGDYSKDALNALDIPQLLPRAQKLAREGQERSVFLSDYARLDLIQQSLASGATEIHIFPVLHFRSHIPEILAIWNPRSTQSPDAEASGSRPIDSSQQPELAQAIQWIRQIADRYVKGAADLLARGAVNRTAPNSPGPAHWRRNLWRILRGTLRSTHRKPAQPQTDEQGPDIQDTFQSLHAYWARGLRARLATQPAPETAHSAQKAPEKPPELGEIKTIDRKLQQRLELVRQLTAELAQGILTIDRVHSIAPALLETAIEQQEVAQMKRLLELLIQGFPTSDI